MRVVFGIGNPGARYAGTRHNLGFMVLDALAHDAGAEWREIPGLRADGAPLEIAGERIWLIRPLTYVNRCGPVAAAIHRRDEVPVDSILVVVDDLALPPGRLRLRARGSDGGHNGLKSLIASLGTGDFPRLRIGIGDPGTVPAETYVLEPFAEEERAAMERAIGAAADAVRLWVEQGVEKAMAEVNRADLDHPRDRA
jgi:PTH1 family peptidyl-tRNA hydrolase